MSGPSGPGEPGPPSYLDLNLAPGGENSSAPWYAQGVKFTCQSGCTRCCGGAPGDVWVSDAEVRAIAEFMHLPVAEFEKKYVRLYFMSGRKSLKELANGDCVMLRKNGCGIYSVRPKQCRDYPFWPEVMKNVFNWVTEAQRCPGINEGELHSAPKIAEMLKTQVK